MHDRTGKPLKVGDKVTVLYVIKAVSPQDDYCNCTLESVYGRKPDGAKETVSSVNTATADKVD